MLQNSRILVTGGAGFIGSTIIGRLTRLTPEAIVVVDNFFTGNMENLESSSREYPQLKIYADDASDYSFMHRLLDRERIDIVLDLAVKPLPYSFENPEGAYMNSVRIASVLCELLSKSAFSRLIHFSSSEAYGNAVQVPMTEEHPLRTTTPYAAGKASADLLIMSYYNTFGLNTTILRPFNVYGPRQNVASYAAVVPITISRILQGKSPFIEWDGEQTRDFSYVEDVSKACILTIERNDLKGRIINLAQGKDTRISEIIRMITQIMGYRGDIEYRQRRPADVARQCGGGGELAKSLLGYEPETSLENGLRKTVDWFRNHAKQPRINQV